MLQHTFVCPSGLACTLKYGYDNLVDSYELRDLKKKIADLPIYSVIPDEYFGELKENTCIRPVVKSVTLLSEKYSKEATTIAWPDLDAIQYEQWRLDSKFYTVDEIKNAFLDFINPD